MSSGSEPRWDPPAGEGLCYRGGLRPHLPLWGWGLGRPSKLPLILAMTAHQAQVRAAPLEHHCGVSKTWCQISRIKIQILGLAGIHLHPVYHLGIILGKRGRFSYRCQSTVWCGPPPHGAQVREQCL